MKNIIIVSILLTLGSRSNAQLFHKQDSIRQNPIIHGGAGGYFGTHYFVPMSSGFTYYNTPGYNQGFFIKAILNITPSLYISLDGRYTECSGNVGLKNDAVYNTFLLKTSGFQIPCLINYAFINKKKAELFGVSSGIAFNQMLYQYSNVDNRWSQRYYYPVTVGGVNNIDDSPSKYLSFLFAINKRIKFTKRNYLVVFNEYEWQLDNFNVENAVYNYNTQAIQSYSTNFKSLSMRLGVYFTF